MAKMTKVWCDRALVRVWLIPIALFFIVAIGSWQFDRSNPPPDISQRPISRTDEFVNEPIEPIPLQLALDPRKVALGDKLFHDRQLSSNNTISCASCHDLTLGGTDGLVVSVGIDGHLSTVNAPTVFNSGFNFKQFWDGRADTLEEQIEGPANSLREFGSSWSDIIAKLKTSSEYTALFKQIYRDEIAREYIKDAIATFERSLMTPNSRSDRFLRGEKMAITSKKKRILSFQILWLCQLSSRGECWR